MIHGLLSEGTTKLSSNISLDMLPPSQNPTSFATISALSWICLGSWGFVQSLFTNWIFLCFPSSGTSHLMYKASLSSADNREVNLFARNSLSRLNALMLHKKNRMEGGKKIRVIIPIDWSRLRERKERRETLTSERLLARPQSELD